MSNKYEPSLYVMTMRMIACLSLVAGFLVLASSLHDKVFYLISAMVSFLVWWIAAHALSLLEEVRDALIYPARASLNHVGEFFKWLNEKTLDPQYRQAEKKPKGKTPSKEADKVNVYKL